jgi:hypothetical protein
MSGKIFYDFLMVDANKTLIEFYWGKIKEKIDKGI